MPAGSDEFRNAVVTEACGELHHALSKIRHCLDQLDESQVWWRPEPGMNSIGNLILHLSGNLRQWIVSGIGGARDVRDRSSEFAEQGPIAKSQLIESLETAVGDAVTALRATTADELLRSRRIQGFEVTGIGAIFHSVPHFRGHTQEIIHLTRRQLGDKYRFDFIPATPEQGAAPAR